MDLKEEGVTYVERLEHNVNDDTDRLVCFDARYFDSNLRFDADTNTWIHYATPGLFRNITQVYLNEDTGVWLPVQSHPDIAWI